MPQRDFILRLIEQLGSTLAELRRRVLQQADPTGVRADLARVAAQAGFAIEMLRGFDIPTLHLLVAPAGGDVDITRCWLMGALYLEKSSASRLADGLERKGYITRRQHPDDARYIQIELSKPGRALAQKLLDDLVDERSGMLLELTPAERRTVIRSIEKLASIAASGVDTSRGCQVVR